MKHIFEIFILCFLFFSCNKEKTVKLYYDNGMLKERYILRNDLMTGEYIFYYPTGKIYYEAHYKDGLKEGVEIEYYENGNIKMKGQREFGCESGFYYYYNINQKLDSIKEYVLIHPDSTISAYFRNHSINSNIGKVSQLNRYVTYDENGKTIFEKSLFYEVKLLNDIVNVGDSICSELFFFNQTGSRDNKFKVYVYQDDQYIVLTPLDNSKLVLFCTRAEQKGENYFQGFIEEYLDNDYYNYIFFKEPYYVK